MHKLRMYFVLFIVLCSACGQQPAPASTPIQAATVQATSTPTALAQPAVQASVATRTHTLVSFTGGVEILLSTDGPAFAATQGLPLPADASIRVPSGESAIVLCDSLSAVRIGGGERSLNGVCPEPRAVTMSGGRPRSLARPAGANLLPFIIEPRASRTFSPPKIIRWNATKPPYSVSIADADQTPLADMNNVLTNSLNLATNLTWQKEMTYTVTVIDANGAYSENGWFYLLADDQAAIMNEQTALLTSNLHREGAPQEGVLQAQAALYQANELYADALTILEPLAQTTNQPMTLFILAECYRLTDKYQMAIEHYGRAQATVRNDREWLMLAFIAQGSGMSARILRENDKARLELQKARGIFVQLLQNNYAKAIDVELSKISNP